MPNPIRYSTTGVTQSVKKGNFYTGTGDTDKGPSSSTLYYAGITPPIGGYTIYLSRPTGDFSIYVAANDTQLLTITNRIANTSYTTATECLVYFSTQSDKMVVSRDYENIITNGLVVYLDPSHSSGYPKSGTTLYDLSGNNNNSTLVNGPTYSNINNGLTVLDGIDDHIIIPGNASTYTANFTWQSFHYIRNANGSDLDAMWWSEQSGKNFLMGYRNTGIATTYFRIDSPTTVYQSPAIGTQTNGFSVNAGPVTGQWIFTTIVKNGTTFTLYWGTTLMWTVTISDWNIGSPSQNIAFGAQAGGAYPNAMDMGNVLMYNRALSITEITQNYNALKDKYNNLFLNLNAGNIVSYPGSGTTWFDISGNGNNATLTAATASGNNAINFNRTNNTRAIVPSLNLSTTSKITINMWVKFLSLPTGGGDTFRFLAELSDNYNSYSDSFFMAIATELSTNRWFTQDKGNVGYNAKNLSTPLPQTNTWYNFTVVYDHTQTASNERTFYIDGVNQTNIASTEGGTTYNSDNTNNFGNRPLHIGGRSTTTFSSNMDLGVFQIYTKALNATEVSQSYVSLKDTYPNIVTTNLTHLFDAGNVTSYAGSGTVWTNLSGPNNLRLVNTPTFVSNGEASRFVFDGVNDHMTGSGYLTGSAPKSHTLSFIGSFAALPSTFTRHRFFSDNGNPSSYGVSQPGTGLGPGEVIISQGTPNFNATVYDPTGAVQFISQSQTAMFTFVSSNTGINFYLNGSQLGGTITDTFADGFTNPTSIFWWASNANASTPLSMSFSHIMWYSSSLSGTEITQNYNALKQRYGI
jgi:hypothetical protein